MTELNEKRTTACLSSKSAYIALLCSSPVLLVLVFRGNWEMGIGAWICTGVVILVMQTRWDLRERPWFWLTISLALLLQIPLVLLIPWRDRGLTGISLLPLGVLDYGIVYGCVKLVEKAVWQLSGQKDQHSVSGSADEM